MLRCRCIPIEIRMHTKCKHESVEVDHCGFREEYPIVKTVQKLCCLEKPYYQKKKWRLFRSKGLKYVYIIVISTITITHLSSPSLCFPSVTSPFLFVYRITVLVHRVSHHTMSGCMMNMVNYH